MSKIASEKSKDLLDICDLISWRKDFRLLKSLLCETNLSSTKQTNIAFKLDAILEYLDTIEEG